MNAAGTAPLPLLEIERVLQEACGVALSAGIRRTLGDAFVRAARDLGVEAPSFLSRLLAGEPRCVTALVESSVVGETYFFRHPEQFEALRALVLEPAPRDRPLSIWSAGCASGEEPYSLAMALLDAGRASVPDRILATDVSARALETARQAVYGEWSLRRLDPVLRRRHFAPEGSRLSVLPAARERVELRRHNLVHQAAAGAGFDVVVCRNVLIYFTAETAAAVVRRLFEALRPGGILVVAPVEVPLAAGLDADRVEVAGAIVHRRRAPGAARPAPPPRASPSAARRRVDGGRPRRGREPARSAPAAPAPVCAAPEPASAAAPPGFEAAREAARRGDLEAAERIAREVAARELCPESYLLLSMAADARGDVAGAVDAVRRALYLDPGLAMGHAALVPLYARLGLDEQAARARRNALLAIEGLDDGAVLRGVETITAGALRSALGVASQTGRSATATGSHG